MSPMARRPMPRLRRTAAAVATCLLAVTGCQFDGVSSLPLPGGPSLGAHPYRVVVEFSNVLELVPYSLVKVDDVTVGKVVRVKRVGWHAQVTCLVKAEVQLPTNAVATIEQTSLLGEKFVSLSAPAGRARSGTLRPGSGIPLRQTSEDVEIEQVLSALSLLVNDGGLEQIATITDELNAALHGSSDTVRDVLRQLTDTVRTLNAQRGTIVAAIRNLDRLTAKLAVQRSVLGRALDQITPAVRLLARQRAQLTDLLAATNELGVITDRVINKSAADFLANLRALRPIAANLAKAGAQLPQALELMLTFPFPRTATNALKGDYANLTITADLRTTSLLRDLLSGTALPAGSGPALAGVGSGVAAARPPLTAPPATPLGLAPAPASPARDGAGALGGLAGLLTGGLR